MRNNTGKAKGINAYNQVSVQTDISDASPHRIIQMLIDAALQKICAAKGFIENKNISKKGELLGQTISIIDCLRASLDKSKGGEVAENLDLLYDYMLRRLTEVNINGDVAILDEVASLLKPIKEAWDAIPEDIREWHQKLQVAEDESAESKSAVG